MKFRKVLTATAAVLAAVAVLLLATMPPSGVGTTGETPHGLRDRTVSGAYHVHSTVSDGTASRDYIAAAAARAGLQFVIFTDHGDGTRIPEPPQYRHGVLCLDGVEISTNGGHYVALDMEVSPFPLGGEAAAVVEDVRRLGGFGIAAHPDSPRNGLSWTDWSLPIDGLEWLNADSEWRDESRVRLLRFPFDYAIRPGPALASILDRPAVIDRWDDLSAKRPVVGLAGHDAHGGIARRADSPQRLALPGFPSYEASFRSFTTRAILGSPLTGEASGDARLLLQAVRHGRVFTVIDAIAAPGWLDFRAVNGDAEFVMGESVAFGAGLTIHATAAVPDGGRLVLLCNGSEVAESTSGQVSVPAPEPGACRAEVRQSLGGRADVPWLVGNPIYFPHALDEPVVREPLFELVRQLDDLAWTVEKDRASVGSTSRSGNDLVIDYQLEGIRRASQYVAAAAALQPPLPLFDRIIFTASAKTPMRISVQLRFDRSGGERWTTSIYLSPEPRRVSVALADLVVAGHSRPAPDFRNADTLLLVIDLTNAGPGAAGQVLVSDLSLARTVQVQAGRAQPTEWLRKTAEH